LLSPSPPINAVLPAEESATLTPKSSSSLFAPRPVSFALCCLQVECERVKSHTAPARSRPGSSFIAAPMSAVSPSEESARPSPKLPLPASPAAVSFGPCCVHLEPERVKAHTAPSCPPALPPPTSAVLPLPDSARLLAQSVK
jgi:hypothetical protein